MTHISISSTPTAPVKDHLFSEPVSNEDDPLGKSINLLSTTIQSYQNVYVYVHVCVCEYVCVCVFVCMCERERVRDRQTESVCV